MSQSNLLANKMLICETGDMKKNNKKSMLNEVVSINGSKVFVENGVIKTVLSENIQNSGYMSVEEARQIGLEIIKKEYAIK